MRTRDGLLVLALSSLAACGPAEEPLPPEAWLRAAAAPVPTAAPIALTRSSLADLAVEPIEITPSVACPCGDRTVVIGETAIGMLEENVLMRIPEPVVDAHVAAALESAIPFEWRMWVAAGAYDGPGGAPLFAWRSTSARPTLLVDRDVSAARLAGALRALEDMSNGVVMRGVDASGAPVCFLTLSPAIFEGAEPGRAYEVRVDASGTATSERDGVSFTIDGTVAPWPGQRADERIPVHVRPTPGLGASALVRAAARVASPQRHAILAP